MRFLKRNFIGMKDDPVFLAATVQLVCVLFGMTRNFLKFGFDYKFCVKIETISGGRENCLLLSLK